MKKKLRIEKKLMVFIALASLYVLEFQFSGSIWVKGFSFSPLSFGLALRDLKLDQGLCWQIVGLATERYWDIPDGANQLACCLSQTSVPLPSLKSFVYGLSQAVVYSKFCLFVCLGFCFVLFCFLSHLHGAQSFHLRAWWISLVQVSCINFSLHCPQELSG